jgi:hypothetical protein
MALLAIGAVGTGLAYDLDALPKDWGPDPQVPERGIWIAVAVAGMLAVLFITAAIVNARRWHMYRVVLKLSSDPALVSLSQVGERSPAEPRAAAIPPLEVRIMKARKLARPRGRLRRVTVARNVVGHRPLQIAYLRLFENQPRMRTFIEGAWREFGYVHLLRGAASVTRAEYRWARRSGTPSALFVSSREQLLAQLEAQRDQPYRKGRYRFKAIGARTIRVRDRYGSYPMRAILCHGNYWQAAVDLLLDRIDLVSFDLSGLTERNVGTLFELHRVIDRFPIERVVFLADQRSNHRFLASVIQEAWLQMAEGSPNATAGARIAEVVVTDYYARSAQGGQQGQATQVQVRLLARRRQTRRVANRAQERTESLV